MSDASDFKAVITYPIPCKFLTEEAYDEGRAEAFTVYKRDVPTNFCRVIQ